MTDSQYYYYSYSRELNRSFKTQSDTIVFLADLARQAGVTLNSSISSLNPSFKTELSKNYVITTSVTGQQVNRIIHKGDFVFNGNELVDGTVSQSIVVFQDGTVEGKRYGSPVSWPSIVSTGSVLQAIRGNTGESLTTTGDLSGFFPAGWSARPFDGNLVSIGSTAGGSGSSSGSSGSSTTQTLTTTSSVDTLTGIKKKKDIFRFDADPSGQVDKVTGFNAKEKDVLSISRSAFGIEQGTFSVAKNAKTLAKQLGTSVDIVYYQKKGELILNANGTEPGYGDDGGVFAVLMGRPTVGSGSVQFY